MTKADQIYIQLRYGSVFKGFSQTAIDQRLAVIKVAPSVKQATTTPHRDSNLLFWISECVLLSPRSDKQAELSSGKRTKKKELPVFFSDLLARFVYNPFRLEKILN